MLTLLQRERARQDVSTSGVPVNYTQPQIDPALDAVSNYIEANRASLADEITDGSLSLAHRQALSVAIDTSTLFLFTLAQKRAIVEVVGRLYQIARPAALTAEVVAARAELLTLFQPVVTAVRAANPALSAAEAMEVIREVLIG